MLDLAIRNLWRNRRRSFSTVASIAIGTVAVVLFSAFSANVKNGLETETVARMGHLALFKQGYFRSGGGNTGAYGIEGYQNLLVQIQKNPELGPLVRVVTPVVNVAGIVGNESDSSSTTFIAQGVVPEDRAKMALWNPYNLPAPADALTSGVPEGKTDEGILGIGLARILNLETGQQQTAKPPPVVLPPRDVPDLNALSQEMSTPKNPAEANRSLPIVHLLAATSGGAPNVVRLKVAHKVFLSVKELNDHYIALPLPLAQNLLFGRSSPKVTSLVLQLHKTDTLMRAKILLEKQIRDLNLPLEVFDFKQLSPVYTQVNAFYGVLSLCLMVLFTTVSLFMTMNTVTTTVYERTREIGVLRALGMGRFSVRWLFVIEGLLLGVLGATFGILLSDCVVFLLNHSGLTWMPPGSLGPVPIQFNIAGATHTVVVLWSVLVLGAGGAAWFAARRASSLQIVAALRFV